MKKINEKNIEKYLFIISMLITTFLGLVLFYNFEFKNNLNLLFDSDSSRVIGDASSYFYNHYRSSVHPLFVLIIQPLCFLLNGLTLDRMISLVLLSSLTTSTTVVFIYKILNTIKNNPKQNIIISLVYLFSFGNIVFTSGIEVYNFAVLFIVLLWYYYIIKRDKSFDKYSYILLILLGISTAAITITNFIIYFIILGLLLITKKINIKKTIIISIITIIGLISLNTFQHFIWKTTPLMWQKELTKEKEYVTIHKIDINNVKNVLKNDYYNSLISSNIKVKVIKNNFYNGDNYVLLFNKTNYINIILITIFYLLLIILIVRNIKKDLFLNLGLLATLLFNTALHIIYGNNSTYLYSLHFIYIFILLFGINLSHEKNNKLKKEIKVFLPIFLIAEVIINSYYFTKLIKIVSKILTANIFVEKLGLLKTILLEGILVLIILFIIKFLLQIKKKISKKNSKEKNIILILLLTSSIISVELVFNFLYSYKEKNNYIEEKIKVIDSTKINDKTKYIDDSFKKHYKVELTKLEEYKNEYLQFLNNYSSENTDKLNETVYYYLGFGPRRKLMYKPGLLMDIDSREVLYEFDEEESMIIPNIYTVIIETKDHKYIKIYEDRDGVHYNIDGKDKIIDGTSNKIELYNFSKQKYENIKRVLYGEILFNIKDSKIYPNIIVYNKPWYRDAAITSMVLRQTNNTNLIIDWVNNIDELFDNNNDNEEPDNLGELLYLLSLQENRNNELIDRIESKAEDIATNNPNGYYIYGKTDFTDQYLYQNLWYKLGIEAVGREYHFDIDDIKEDDYSKGAWWSDYNTSKFNNTNSNYEYPYLSYAIRHSKKEGNIIMNRELYPLSWEVNASHANYDNYSGLDFYMKDSRISPLHTWSAAELLLFIMDETDNLDKEKLR